jgi:hypothetical protein
MESLIGVGQAGCNIVSLLKKYPIYNDFYIDTGIKGTRCISLSEFDKTEDYEENGPNLKRRLSSIQDIVHFFMAGSGKVSGAALTTLEQIKDRKLKINYIRPDLHSIGSVATKRERVVFSVLQQFARSGLFDNLTLIDNNSMESILGDVPLIGYHDRLNELLASTYHMINVFSNSKAIMGSGNERQEISRISTIGLFDVQTGDEQLFYPLDRITEKTFFFAYNEERLRTDGTLGKKIKEIMNKKLDTGIKTSYNVYTTQYEEDYGYCIARTSIIQGEDYNV